MKYSFKYNGKIYSGSFLSTPDDTPEFHWFICNEQELVDLIGASIVFTANGQLVTARTKKTANLIKIVRNLLTEYVSERKQLIVDDVSAVTVNAVL